MKSPFPGMDPYLEARWSDVHVKLITYIGESLSPMLPEDLRARSEERVLLEEVGVEAVRVYRADVAVTETDRPGGGTTAGAAVATPQPYVILFQEEPYVDRFVQIIDVRHGNKLVTAIEVLSPGNKSPGRLNEDYRRKLNDYEQAGVSVVEIDLLRSSRDRLRVTSAELPPAGRAPYMACVHKGWIPGRWEAYPISLRAPIPPIPVPLRRSDPSVTLQLQPLIERIYVASRHDDIDYSKSAVPPLGGDDAAWADELLRGAGLR